MSSAVALLCRRGRRPAGPFFPANPELIGHERGSSRLSSEHHHEQRIEPDISEPGLADGGPTTSTCRPISTSNSAIRPSSVPAPHQQLPGADHRQRLRQRISRSGIRWYWSMTPASRGASGGEPLYRDPAIRVSDIPLRGGLPKIPLSLMWTVIAVGAIGVCGAAPTLSMRASRIIASRRWSPILGSKALAAA